MSKKGVLIFSRAISFGPVFGDKRLKEPYVHGESPGLQSNLERR